MNCENCGACCRILPMAVNKLTREERQIINTRHKVTVETNNGIHYIVFKSPCIYLENGRCSIHERKPEYCKKFECGGAECLQARKIEGVE